MPRPRCRARVRGLPSRPIFKPRGVPLARLELIDLSGEEFEALRLADLQGLYHAEAAGRMGVSRPTFGRILASARGKTAAALAQGKGIRIGGGSHHLADKEGRIMKIAVATDERNRISSHFGRSAFISVFEIEDGVVLGREDRPFAKHGGGEGHGREGGRQGTHTAGCGGPQGSGRGGGRGHAWLGALVGDADAMVCGGIGAGARDKIGGMGLRLLVAEPDESPEAAARRVALLAAGDERPPACPDGR